jgi:23S rRNA (uracil1939-C5)-methyltransferase
MTMVAPSLSVGSKLELIIDGVSAFGEGIGHVAGRAVFVPFSIPGERVSICIQHAGKKRIEGRLVDVLEASDLRCQAGCPAFGSCGGCQLMHLSYPGQLDLKRRVLLDNLRSVAKLDWEDEIPVAGAKRPLAYRNRGRYPVAVVGKRVVTGFFAPRSHRVIPVERCAIHHQELDAVVAELRRWAGRMRIPIYRENSTSGWLRHVVVRRSEYSRDILVSLVGKSDRAGGYGSLLRLLRTRCQISGLSLNINQAVTNVILGGRDRMLWGRPWIVERIAGLNFRLSTHSFFQVNTRQAEVLFAKVREFFSESEGLLVDAYCGVGVLASILAAEGHCVMGIEMVHEAIKDARLSAADNGLNVDFHVGRVEKVLPRLVEDGLTPAGVILDPPRKGCDMEVLMAVAQSGCQRIAYVSCHPGSLARDLARLRELGYVLVHLEAVDMFPQTSHLETFAGLVRA